MAHLASDTNSIEELTTERFRNLVWDVTHTNGAYYKTLPCSDYEAARKWRRHIALIEMINNPNAYAAIKEKPPTCPAPSFPGHNNEQHELEKMVASRERAKEITDEMFAELQVEEDKRREENKKAKKDAAETEQPQNKSRRAKRTTNEADIEQPEASASSEPPSKRARNASTAVPLPKEVDLLPEVASRQLSSLPLNLIGNVAHRGHATPFSAFFDPRETALPLLLPNFDAIKEAITAENKRAIEQSELHIFTFCHIFKFFTFSHFAKNYYFICTQIGSMHQRENG